MSELNFRADAETLRILEKIGLDKKDDFINRAVKAYATTGAAPGDVASQLNAEIERLVGPNSGVSASLAPGNPQLVEFYNAGGGKIASLELSECQAILKSLRPPISLAEVVEMLTLMSVG